MGALEQPVGRQPVTTYGIKDNVVSPAEERRPIITSGTMLLVLFIALAVATLWFVGRPILAASSTAERACERVVVQDSGAATCLTQNGRTVRVG